MTHTPKVVKVIKDKEVRETVTVWSSLRTLETKCDVVSWGLARGHFLQLLCGLLAWEPPGGAGNVGCWTQIEVFRKTGAPATESCVAGGVVLMFMKLFIQFHIRVHRKKKSSNPHSFPKHEIEICVSGLSSYRMARNVVVR